MNYIYQPGGEVVCRNDMGLEFFLPGQPVILAGKREEAHDEHFVPTHGPRTWSLRVRPLAPTLR